MHPSADKNKEWQYPPLTSQDFEELFHYYKWDGHEGVTPRGNPYEIHIYFPLADEESYAQHGFRVKLCIQIGGRFLWKYPAIGGATAEKAEQTIREIIRLTDSE